MEKQEYAQPAQPAKPAETAPQQPAPYQGSTSQSQQHAQHPAHYQEQPAPRQWIQPQPRPPTIQVTSDTTHEQQEKNRAHSRNESWDAQW